MKQPTQTNRVAVLVASVLAGMWIYPHMASSIPANYRCRRELTCNTYTRCSTTSENCVAKDGAPTRIAIGSERDTYSADSNMSQCAIRMQKNKPSDTTCEKIAGECGGTRANVANC